jgi:hypothetical protein
MGLRRKGWVGLVGFFFVGLLVGGWTSEGRRASTGAPSSGHSPQLAENDALGSPRGGDETNATATARRRALLEAALGENEDHPQADLFRLLARFNGDPTEVIGVVVDAMTRKELIASVSSFTDISPEKLKNSADPKAFAQRLAQLAMEGLLHTGPEPTQAASVIFTDGLVPPVDGEVPAGVRKIIGDGPVLASFPMGSYENDEVFVKWTRVDDPKIMLFNHYPIRPEQDFNYVWLRPKEGWEPGEYQVNFYSADDTMTPLAEGRYVIDSNP